MAIATPFFGVHGIGGEYRVEHVGGVDLGTIYTYIYIRRERTLQFGQLGLMGYMVSGEKIEQKCGEKKEEKGKKVPT